MSRLPCQRFHSPAQGTLPPGSPENFRPPRVSSGEGEMGKRKMNRGETYTVGGVEARGKEGDRCNKSGSKPTLQTLTWEALESGSPKTQL